MFVHHGWSPSTTTLWRAVRASQNDLLNPGKMYHSWNPVMSCNLVGGRGGGWWGMEGSRGEEDAKRQWKRRNDRSKRRRWWREEWVSEWAITLSPVSLYIQLDLMPLTLETIHPHLRMGFVMQNIYWGACSGNFYLHFLFFLSIYLSRILSFTVFFFNETQNTNEAPTWMQLQMQQFTKNKHNNASWLSMQTQLDLTFGRWNIQCFYGSP